MLLQRLAPGPGSTLLEVGVGNTEPGPTTNFLVKHYPWPERVTALGLGDVEGFKRLHPSIRAVSYDGDRFPFPDGEFDVAHSNAVIEHVGSRGQQVRFLAELGRVARRGMVTTPNRWFPVETHSLLPLLHWGGEERYRRWLRRIGPARLEGFHRLVGLDFPWSEVDSLRLLGAGELKALATEAGMRDVEVLPNRVAGLPVTLSLLFGPR